jgi:uncharacterized membrane protein YdfJ with MMPL/SSD domain
LRFPNRTRVGPRLKFKVMISSCIRRLRVTGFFFLLAVAFAMPASAKTIAIPTTDAHFEVPNDWTVTSRNDMALYALAPDGKASATVALFTNQDGKGVDDPEFFSNLEGVLNERATKERASMKVVSEGPTDLNGVPADYLQAELAFAEGGVAYGRSYAIGENNHILVLTLLSPDPGADAHLQAIAKTLRFDHPPLLPGATIWTNYHLGWVLLALVVFVLIGLGALAAMKRRSS